MDCERLDAEKVFAIWDTLRDIGSVRDFVVHFTWSDSPACGSFRVIASFKCHLLLRGQVVPVGPAVLRREKLIFYKYSKQSVLCGRRSYPSQKS